MLKFRYIKFLIFLTALLAVIGPLSVSAQRQPINGGLPSLGTAKNFAVLGGSTVTNTGSTVVTGNLGVWPGTAVTGFPPGIVNGSIEHGNAVTQQAQSDVMVAYNDLAGRACDVDLSGTDLGGLTLTEGVYCFSSSAQLTGPLVLDAEGNAAALFIFQIASTLTTASNSSVQVINNGTECNIFWQVGSSATLGTSTVLDGNILALTSITLNTDANVSGRTLARNGAVTIDTNDISIVNCTETPTDVSLINFGSENMGPNIGLWSLFLLSLLSIIFWTWRKIYY
ncbi:MAG TPA: ice-binding family protein [Anaerolineae bacterium]|nr:ice-binding family protein [Anaerolineae bacterium]